MLQLSPLKSEWANPQMRTVTPGEDGYLQACQVKARVSNMVDKIAAADGSSSDQLPQKGDVFVPEKRLDWSGLRWSGQAHLGSDGSPISAQVDVGKDKPMGLFRREGQADLQHHEYSQAGDLATYMVVRRHDDTSRFYNAEGGNTDSSTFTEKVVENLKTGELRFGEDRSAGPLLHDYLV